MSAVDTVVTDLAIVDQELFSYFGINVGQPSSYSGPPPPPTVNPTVWLGLENSILEMAGEPPSWGYLDEFSYQQFLNRRVADLIYRQRQAAMQTAAAIQHLHDYALAIAEYGAAVATNNGNNAAATVRTYAQQLFNQAEADLSTWATALVQSDRNITANLTGLIQSTSAGDRGYTDDRFGKAEADLNTWATALVQSDRDVAANAAAYTDSKFGQAESDLTKWATALVQSDKDVEANLTGALSTTALTLTNQIVNAAGSAEANAVAQAVTQLQPQIDKLRTEADTCLAPLCDEVTPNADTLGKLGKTLSAFKGLGLAGLLVGLAAEAVHDPETSAGAVVDVLSWTTDISTEIVSAVVG